jgi:UDP-N-acetylmuramyl pentapeptide phosphotransferase/UDP-N-acetylglucosamine-1-phosphate transferase
MGSGYAAGVAVAVFAATLALTGPLRRWLERREILDRPVERSSHRVPVPRGAGLVLVPALLAGWLILAWHGAPHGTLLVTAAAAALAAVSWRDDVGGLAVPLRLALHAAAVAVGVFALPPILPGALPWGLDRALAGLLWLWFVELYNFMDGIDGIAGVETVALGAGIALVLGGIGGTAALALAAAAAALGFLCWNWHPARIFLGDVGSVPLGYLLGWLLLQIAASGFWAAALILPLYYLADASITLARRIARRAPFWQAHREHFYQRALGRDCDHAAVARLVALGNAALIVLALVSRHRPGLALLLAAVVTGSLLALLRHRAVRG